MMRSGHPKSYFPELEDFLGGLADEIPRFREMGFGEMPDPQITSPQIRCRGPRIRFWGDAIWADIISDQNASPEIRTFGEMRFGEMPDP